jgi:DNA-directed RNA polymerase subunit RPC12/RpoP
MSAAFPRADGIHVVEGTESMNDVHIVEVVYQTLWKCPNPRCGVRWAKRGLHAGRLKRCRRCGSRFFLRR